MQAGVGGDHQWHRWFFGGEGAVQFIARATPGGTGVITLSLIIPRDTTPLGAARETGDWPSWDRLRARAALRTDE